MPDTFEMETIDDLFRGALRPWIARRPETAPRIKLDVSEDDKRCLIKADVPGVRKEDIDVCVDGDQVTISAEVKKEQTQEDKGRLLRSERQYGYACRSFSLGCDVADAKAIASMP